jgi:hypothetical protein
MIWNKPEKCFQEPSESLKTSKRNILEDAYSGKNRWNWLVKVPLQSASFTSKSSLNCQPENVGQLDVARGAGMEAVAADVFGVGG